MNPKICTLATVAWAPVAIGAILPVALLLMAIMIFPAVCERNRVAP